MLVMMGEALGDRVVLQCNKKRGEMKLEYDFDLSRGTVIFDGEDNRISDGEIVILFRRIDPKVSGIQIRFCNSNRLGGWLVHSWERGWIAWRGSGPNPTKLVHLLFNPPQAVELAENANV